MEDEPVWSGDRHSQRVGARLAQRHCHIRHGEHVLRSVLGIKGARPDWQFELGAGHLTSHIFACTNAQGGYNNFVSIPFRHRSIHNCILIPYA